MKLFSTVVIAVVAITIIASFFLIGSPQNARELQFDDMRSNHLSNIRYEIHDYWRVHKKLPATLEQARAERPAFEPYRDPVTGVGYEYIPTGEKIFQLCATFGTERKSESDYYPKPVALYSGMEPNFMVHPSGRYCFDNLLDERLFEPYPPPVTTSTSTSTTST